MSKLEFGTGGLRGIMGPGEDQLNETTIRRTTQGLADYINKESGEDKSVAIAYDSRHHSPAFAETAALCLAANGIKVYLYESLRPTPQLSFTVRELGCMAGVVITASHNPPQYNGYKVYWADGGQITPPRDREIAAVIDRIAGDGGKTMDMAKALQLGLVCRLGAELDHRYQTAVCSLVLSPAAIAAVGKDLKIVYTPLHGSGRDLVPQVLTKAGFGTVYLVAKQQEADGDFPTVHSPNPEEDTAFKMALDLAREKDADLVIATDPDADRIGVYAKIPQTGAYYKFTGNMLGVLLFNYRLQRKQESGLIKNDATLVRTIVTTRMADGIAAANGISVIETLTGFKYIGEQIRLAEESKQFSFEFGFEESYGCLMGTFVRDKDAVSAALGICDAAAFYRQQGTSLYAVMQELYERYGHFREGLVTKTLTGKNGQQKMAQYIKNLRSQTPETISGLKIIKATDYLNGNNRLPKADVLYYELEDESWFCVRPSGTEPKLKVYFGVKGSTPEAADERLKLLQDACSLSNLH